MREGAVYQLEGAKGVATVYLFDTPTARELDLIHVALDTLPADVRVLRVAIAELSHVSDTTPSIIRTLRRHWQGRRDGKFGVSVGRWTDAQNDSGRDAQLG